VLEPRTYLGLELSGAKNEKTALAAIQYYPKERKIFLLDIYDRIAAQNGQSSDDALLELLDEMRPGIGALGVNVPLELPPCMSCTRKSCPLPAHCTVPSVKWMRDATRRAGRGDKDIRVKDFTPYTQRPVELWARYQIMPELGPAATFEIDETLGGNKAPLTSRMHFLRRHLAGIKLLEVWPKLTIAALSESMGVSKRTLSNYRKLEEGMQARSEILESLSSRQSVFIYERDLRKLSHSLAAFDAFVCAFTALLADLNECVRVPTGFPGASGWVQYPKLRSEGRS
jgi:hypothetical protein